MFFAYPSPLARQRYGRLDVLIYSSGAVWWASVEDTPVKRYQLMQRVNADGLYGAVQAALPHLKKRGAGRIIVVSPPIYSRFFRGKTAYAMGKVAMSVLTKGLAMDFERQGLTDMAITSIWPATVSISIHSFLAHECAQASSRVEEESLVLTRGAVHRVRRYGAVYAHGSFFCNRSSEADNLLGCDHRHAQSPCLYRERSTRARRGFPQEACRRHRLLQILGGAGVVTTENHAGKTT